MSIFFTMTASGAVETQTKTISQTSDDGFVTEIGALFDGPLVTMLDPGMDIRSFVVFRDIEINKWERLQNATLRLYSAGTMETDLSGVTVFGISRVGHYLPIDGLDVFSVPLTASSANADTSTFYGGAILNIDISNIMREFMSHPDWTGDGRDGTGTGDKIGFLILGAGGSRGVRVFYDEFAGNGLEARIILYWGEAPAPPDDPPGDLNDTEKYVWTPEEQDVPYEADPNYNETVDIWKVEALGTLQFQYLGIDGGFDPWYHNASTGTGGAIELTTDNWAPAQDGAATSPILSVGEWTLIMGDPGSTRIYISDDEFTTNSSYDLNDQYPPLAIYAGDMGSLAVDRQTSNMIHAVYTSVTAGQPGTWNPIYCNFSIDPITGIPTFGNYTILDQRGQIQLAPVIYVQENGTLHVVWWGNRGGNEEQIAYRRRHVNGTWFDIVRVSDTDAVGFPHRYPDVVANEETGTALVVWEFDRTDVYWDVVYPNNTDDVDRVANTGVDPSMVADRAINEALLIWNSQTGQPSTVYFQNKTIDNSTAWSGNKQVSPAGEKHFRPDIGIEPVNRSIQVIWWNDWNLNVAGNSWAIQNDPAPAKTTISTENMVRVYIEAEFEITILNVSYFVVWGNGTILGGPFDDLDDVDEFIENFFGVDPADPDPVTQGWDLVGPFQRFRTRLYILMIGIVLVFGPLIYWAMSRPSGYEFLIGAFILLVGFALMYAAGQV